MHFAQSAVDICLFLSFHNFHGPFGPFVAPLSSQAAPSGVTRYFCWLLVGLSGRVISSQPWSSKGLMSWSLNLVRLVRPSMAINSVKAAPVLALVRIST